MMAHYIDHSNVMIDINSQGSSKASENAKEMI